MSSGQLVSFCAAVFCLCWFSFSFFVKGPLEQILTFNFADLRRKGLEKIKR